MKAESVFDIIQSLEPSERKKLDVLMNFERGADANTYFSENIFKQWIIEAQAVYDANKSCMTVKECADFLNVHHNTVKNKLHSGEFKGTLIGRVWSIPKIQFLDKIIKPS